MNLTDIQKKHIERVNDLVTLLHDTNSFHPDGPKNAAVDDEIVIYSRGSLRRGRVTKATAKRITVAYVTPGGVKSAHEIIESWTSAKPYTPADRPEEGWTEGQWAQETEYRQAKINLAKTGFWQLYVNITEKTVPRTHAGAPDRHPGFNCV